jgi:hypothetical protein
MNIVHLIESAQDAVYGLDANHPNYRAVQRRVERVRSSVKALSSLAAEKLPQYASL